MGKKKKQAKSDNSEFGSKNKFAPKRGKNKGKKGKKK